MVLAHSHPEDFFAARDVDVAQDVLLRWLQEDKELALKEAARMSPEGRAVFDELRGNRGALRAQLLASIAKHAAEMARASPRRQLGSLRAPVFLLHGAGDTVIPATELGWLAGEVSPGMLHGQLVTPLLEHVSLQGRPSVLEYARAIHFLAGVLADD
jgi:pimeloyl-ACP methyl ester carboxylesterase